MTASVVTDISLWEAKTTLPRNSVGNQQMAPFDRHFLSTYYPPAASMYSTLGRMQRGRSKADPHQELIMSPGQPDTLELVGTWAVPTPGAPTLGGDGGLLPIYMR